jgi:hypothetical protein
MPHVLVFVTRHAIHNVVNHVIRLVGIDVETLVLVHVGTYALVVPHFATLRARRSVRMRQDIRV